MLTNFQAEQLEEMLYKTSKNVARELVSSLIDMNGKGVLTDIIKSGLGKSEADNGEDEIETFVRSKASKLWEVDINLMLTKIVIFSICFVSVTIKPYTKEGIIRCYVMNVWIMMTMLL